MKATLVVKGLREELVKCRAALRKAQVEGLVHDDLEFKIIDQQEEKKEHTPIVTAQTPVEPSPIEAKALEVVTEPVRRGFKKPHTVWRDPSGRSIYQNMYDGLKDKGRFHLREAERFVSTEPFHYAPDSASPSLSKLQFAGLASQCNGQGEQGWWTVHDYGSSEGIDWSEIGKLEKQK